MDSAVNSLQERLLSIFEQGEALSVIELSRRMNGYEPKSIRNRLRVMHLEGSIHVCGWRRSLGKGGRPAPFFKLGPGDDTPCPTPGHKFRDFHADRKHLFPTRERYQRRPGEFDPFVQLYRPAADFIPDDIIEILCRPGRC